MATHGQGGGPCSALAPHAGERAIAFSSKFPGATQVSALAAPVPLSGGGNNLNIQHDKFAADTGVVAKIDGAGGRSPAILNS